MRYSAHALVSIAALVVLACGGAQPQEAAVSNEPQQTTTALTEDDRARLDEQRAVVEKFLGTNQENLRKYATTAGKLGTIRAVLEAGVFQSQQTYELQCLGVVLGDAFVQELAMEWVVVEDERGRDPAVRLPGTSVILFPLTTISKRIERGEAVDVFDLFNRVAADAERLKAEGV